MPLAPGLTIAEFLERWLGVSKPRLKPRTHHRYAELIRLHINPLLGDKFLDALTTLHIDECYLSLQNGGLSGTTVLQIHRVLHAALSQAVRWSLLDGNPATIATAPRKSRREAAWPLPGEIPRVLAEISGSVIELPAKLALGAGLRLGETLGLRWRDIDFTSGTIRVKQTLQITMAFDVPKSHRSARSIALPAFLTTALVEHRETQSKRPDDRGERVARPGLGL